MNNNLNDGEIHKVVFSKGKLYLDGVQIGGEGILPEKEITFQFKTNLKQEDLPKKEKDPSVLEINVYDKVTGRAVGPGQK